MQPARYGGVAIALHWLIALGVLANIGLGLFFVGVPFCALGLCYHGLQDFDPAKFPLIQLHKSIGLTVLILSVMRVAWRLVNPIPPLPESMSAVLRIVARSTQFLLYVLILALPLSGWALVSSSPLGLPTLYFGQFAWPHIAFLAELPRAVKRPIAHEFATIHVFLAWSAIALVALHVLGALYHQFIRRDGVLAQMLPFAGGAESEGA